MGLEQLGQGTVLLPVCTMSQGCTSSELASLAWDHQFVLHAPGQ